MTDVNEQGQTTEAQATGNGSAPASGGYDAVLHSLSAQLELLRQTFEGSLGSLQERLERLERGVGRGDDEGLLDSLGLSETDDSQRIRRELEETRRKMQRLERQQQVAPFVQRVLQAYGFAGNEPDLYRPPAKAWEENPEMEALKMVASAAEAAANRWRLYLQQHMQRQQEQQQRQQQTAPQFETERPGAETGTPDLLSQLKALPRSEFNRRADFLRRQAMRGEEVQPSDMLALS